MKRKQLASLQDWKTHPLRMPLLIRGARQVGKSYLVRSFAETFEHFIEINFEKDKQAKQIFERSLDANYLISLLATYTSKPIIPGKTLLFFDEVQECEEAITALRYFKEEAPELHVIAAGSLIDFKLKKTGFPVGRVQFMSIYPLSFAEYCEATGQEQLYIAAQNSLHLPSPLHEKLLEEVKRYCCLGGMPAVVEAWRQHKDYALCQDVQQDLLLAYRHDFNKYAKDHQIEQVERVFVHAAYQLGGKFKYTEIDQTIRAANLREALELLEMAGIIYRVYHSSAQGLPLRAGIDPRRFKVYFFDIGLVQRLLGITIKDWLMQPLSVKHAGALAEQFVLQDYIAYTAQDAAPELFYWHREAKQSNAEVDFLFIRQGDIVPAEVKSGHTGRLKSLQLFLESHPYSKYGVKISESNEDNASTIQSIPFYAINGWLHLYS